MSRRLDHHPTPGRRIADIVSLLGVLALTWFLWPPSLGGDTRIITVAGHSMEPEWHLGDALVVRPLDDPAVGDVVVFTVPDGEPGEGRLVVHRLIGRRIDGTWITRGDNRDTDDAFRVTPADIVGSPVLTVPRFAQALAVLRSPLGIALLSGLVTMVVLWPAQREERAARESRLARPWRTRAVKEKARIAATATSVQMNTMFAASEPAMTPCTVERTNTM